MIKVSISKKLHSKWVRFDDGSKELSNDVGYRWMEINFKFNKPMRKFESYEYLMCLEMYLNDREITNECHKYCNMDKFITIVISIKENELKEFNAVYADFKEQYNSLMEYYKNEAEKGCEMIEN